MQITHDSRANALAHLVDEVRRTSGGELAKLREHLELRTMTSIVDRFGNTWRLSNDSFVVSGHGVEIVARYK